MTIDRPDRRRVRRRPVKQNPDRNKLDKPAAGIAGEAASAVKAGVILGGAAYILASAAAAALIAATMGTGVSVRIAEWWLWSGPDETPALTALRFATIVGATIGVLTWGPKSPRAAFWWRSAGGTSAPWLAVLAIRTILNVAGELADELASFL